MGKTRTFEVGVDVSFFENKLNANLTYYNRLTMDKYAAFALPSTTGFSSITNNNGEFQNKGVELELSGRIINREDFSWNMSGNITYNRNIIVSLPDNGLEKIVRVEFRFIQEMEMKLSSLVVTRKVRNQDY